MLEEIMFPVSVSEDADDETGELVEAFEGVECVDFMGFENCLFLIGLCLSFSAFFIEFVEPLFEMSVELCLLDKILAQRCNCSGCLFWLRR